MTCVCVCAGCQNGAIGMAASNAPKNDFAPSWLKIPNENSVSYLSLVSVSLCRCYCFSQYCFQFHCLSFRVVLMCKVLSEVFLIKKPDLVPWKLRNDRWWVLYFILYCHGCLWMYLSWKWVPINQLNVGHKELARGNEWMITVVTYMLYAQVHLPMVMYESLTFAIAWTLLIQNSFKLFMMIICMELFTPVTISFVSCCFLFFVFLVT